MDLNLDLIGKIIPGELYYKEITESTNLDAKMMANALDKSVFLADEQKNGRGRMGRIWSSPSGCGIWMTIYLKPQTDISKISQITLIAGLAVSKVIKKSVIKWPNDILIGQKKVAGILTELSAHANNINCVVVGIGVNVNTEEFPVELRDKATSLYMENGNKVNRTDLICQILEQFFSLYDSFINKGFSAFLKEYEEKCVTVGKEVLIINGEITKKANAVGISENGELIAEIDGKIEEINSCEVSVRGLLGYS